MGSGFQVDLGELSSLVDTLTNAKDAMSQADNALKDASAQDLGTVGLDEAGADFQGKWKYGIKKIAELAGDMATKLRQTEQAYQDNETELAKAFGPPSDIDSGFGPVASVAADTATTAVDVGVGAAASSSSSIANRLAGGDA